MEAASAPLTLPAVPAVAGPGAKPVNDTSRSRSGKARPALTLTIPVNPLSEQVIKPLTAPPSRKLAPMPAPPVLNMTALNDEGHGPREDVTAKTARRIAMRDHEQVDVAVDRHAKIQRRGVVQHPPTGKRSHGRKAMALDSMAPGSTEPTGPSSGDTSNHALKDEIVENSILALLQDNNIMKYRMMQLETAMARLMGPQRSGSTSFDRPACTPAPLPPVPLWVPDNK